MTIIGNKEASYAIGGATYTNKEWERLMNKVDKAQEGFQKDQAERFAETKKSSFADTLSQAAKNGDEISGILRKTSRAPYGYLAKNGVITYNGVTFQCDEFRKQISLGDISDPKENITIPLTGGGSLVVNRDSVDALSQAIGMFSPEDVNRILQALATVAKTDEAKLELEENKKGLGDSTDGQGNGQET